MTVFDPVHLRSFLVVAQTANFTRAAQRLGVAQSTVSQHVRKLEAEAGRPLFTRDTHSVALTADGDVMLGVAHTILDATERAAAHFAGSSVRGRLRFGASEDLVATRLPALLSEFRRRHPAVDVELTVALSGLLREQLDAGDLDLVFGKRRSGETHGTPVWRDRFVWLCGPDAPRVDPGGPVPLVSYPAPSISRARAVEALESAGRSWHVTCTSGSLSGLRAAALAGLGVVAHSAALAPSDLVPAPERLRLPDLGAFDFVLMTGRRADTGPAAALAATILAAGDLHHG